VSAFGRLPQILGILLYAFAFPVLLFGVRALFRAHIVHGLVALAVLDLGALIAPTGILYLTLRRRPSCEENDAPRFRQYAFELNWWLIAYGALLLISNGLLHVVHGLTLQSVIGLTPMVAAFGILHLVIREHRASDELQRQITAESILFAFGATAILTLSYGFLQASAHAPMLSYFCVWPVLGVTWIVGKFIAWRRYN
jgi:hypothetical protein